MTKRIDGTVLAKGKRPDGGVYTDILARTPHGVGLDVVGLGDRSPTAPADLLRAARPGITAYVLSGAGVERAPVRIGDDVEAVQKVERVSREGGVIVRFAGWLDEEEVVIRTGDARVATIPVLGDVSSIDLATHRDVTPEWVNGSASEPEPVD